MPLRCPVRVLAALLLSGLVACAGVPAPPPDLAACAERLAAIDTLVAEAGATDAEAARVHGFPTLRVDRFLASLAAEVPEHAFATWYLRLAARDEAARAVELANLPAARAAALAAWLGEPPARTLADCAARFRAADLADPARRAALRQAARVPDHYSGLSRTLGLYPLTRIGVAAGYRRWQAQNLPAFAIPPENLPIAGTAELVLPEGRPDPEAAARLLAGAPRDALGIPQLGAAEQARLAEAWAPALSIDVQGDFDRIGTPAFAAGAALVDTARPRLFWRLMHARAGAEMLTQIAYTAWFPERPRDGPFDILAGRLDALVWRVSLGADGRPIIFDSIHACGCYHLFFPVPPLRAAPGPASLEDPFLAPLPGQVPGPGQRVVLHVAGRTHYLRGVSVRALGQGAVPLVPDATLQRLADGAGGTRSLFGPDGLVDGSERLERFILWPMGIASAGAMRQFGTHATAFVGRRHFDDPFLFHLAFVRQPRRLGFGQFPPRPGRNGVSDSFRRPRPVGRRAGREKPCSQGAGTRMGRSYRKYCL